ncbi:sigma-54 interaction domain-containing protein [Candidatus Formimonas warabiya]|uniref:Sigma-54 factor interaction domain-containing protein n=1 Tax=Formimonas warabiya TaxID=1761012 RepID=A0A3G1KMC9_FORW1|nr:sigma 54-interacting transcriptional regulator [Candidatus Formimonas warabiya]ATW23579.1 hypothetical protein DCMF_01110 [Candidatus Formimonas warabiya]
MLIKYLDAISKIFDHVDALIIINKQGIVEYSIIYNPEIHSFVNDGFVGKHVFEVYPSLTEETSNHFRVMKSGQPIINETETITDMNGKQITFVNSTFPIEYNSEIIGTIEASVIASMGEKIPHQSAQAIRGDKPSHSLYTLDDIITINPGLLEIKEKIRRVAHTESSVVISGDTGTGKELVAQAIHSHSQRRSEPFISLNCSAIPVTILESILFGTVKGSFTGAENKKGLFELANKGTLFLDELNSMDMAIQSKLLKAIEEKKIRRVGGEEEIDINIRFIGAMNVNPFKAIESGLLRKDLFYRLSVIQINMPSLVERREDINILVDFFMKKYNLAMKKNINQISDIVKETFNNYAWPGNVRELRNAVEYAFNMASNNFITLKEIPEHIVYHNYNKIKDYHVGAGQEKPLKEMVEFYEKELITNTLSITKNITQAAKKLKITRQALQYKIEKYGL